MKTLFDQTEYGGLKLKNRFMRSATFDGRADERGHLTKELFEVYENLAKGGVGTIITGLAYVTNLEQPYPGQLGIYDDSFIEEYSKFTAMCHKYDANIIVQLACLGSQTYLKEGGGKTMWGASAVEDRGYKGTPRALTVEEIHHVQQAFADAALRAKRAGFDGVQLHAAHGYLLSKFLTPYYNRRTDHYGGGIENRAKMLLETYQAVREKVGPAYPVLVKINSEDYMADGMTFRECKYVCKKIAALGGVSMLEISGGSLSSRPNEGYARQITQEQESYFKAQAAEIAKENDVPVILVGGNRNFAALTDILNNTHIAYVAFCRPLICESQLINRWQAGDLRPAKCISCGKCFHPNGTSCIFNRPKTDAL